MATAGGLPVIAAGLEARGVVAADVAARATRMCKRGRCALGYARPENSAARLRTRLRPAMPATTAAKAWQCQLLALLENIQIALAFQKKVNARNALPAPHALRAV